MEKIWAQHSQRLKRRIRWFEYVLMLLSVGLCSLFFIHFIDPSLLFEGVEYQYATLLTLLAATALRRQQLLRIRKQSNLLAYCMPLIHRRSQDTGNLKWALKETAHEFKLSFSGLVHSSRASLLRKKLIQLSVEPPIPFAPSASSKQSPHSLDSDSWDSSLSGSEDTPLEFMNEQWLTTMLHVMTSDEKKHSRHALPQASSKTDSSLKT